MFNNYLETIGCTDFVVRYTDSHKDTYTPGSVESRDHNPLKPDLAFLPTSSEAKKEYEIDQRPREKRRGKKVASRQAGDVVATESTAAPSPPMTLVQASSDRVALAETAGHSNLDGLAAPAATHSFVLATDSRGPATDNAGLVRSEPTPHSSHLSVYHPLHSPGPLPVPMDASPHVHAHLPPSAQATGSDVHYGLVGPGVPGTGIQLRSQSAQTPNPISLTPNILSRNQASLATPMQPSVSAPTPPTATDLHAADGPLAPSNARMTWAWAEVVVEVKHGAQWYPFSVTGFLGTSRRRQISRGQLADYASEIFRRQHREFVFVISICDATARFVRFDRGGAVVSRSFDYTTSPSTLGRFLYRLFGPGSDRVLRGHDPTATLATPGDAELFRGLRTSTAYQGDSTLVAALEHAATANWPIYKIDIPYHWPGPTDQLPARRSSSYPITTREFLVGRPAFSGSSMTGRGTKCMVAYDKTADKLVFIKDMWRPDSPRLQTELETYQDLWEGEESVLVTHIPTCLGGGDVSYNGVVQRTRTHEHLKEQGHLPRIHSRIILKEICRRLVDFTGPAELTISVFDAIEGMLPFNDTAAM